MDIINSSRLKDPTNLETKVEKSAEKFTRHFHVGFYEKYEWLTGCKTLKKLFCWPCLLFNIAEKTYWYSVGITDLNNFHKSIKRHVNSKSHIEEATYCNIIQRELNLGAYQIEEEDLPNLKKLQILHFLVKKEIEGSL
ncbi:unnamed protein product [Psylliodes chrysocephalus]|uniref:Uncharacterized protein n=1 Tax=Psylliodes chrysocephalus TaxID=3402493 RepID=A0A9P0C9A9_9CUCU|nr:unnamed protein product [Psylliodes chrysocephala]